MRAELDGTDVSKVKRTDFGCFMQFTFENASLSERQLDAEKFGGKLGEYTQEQFGLSSPDGGQIGDGIGPDVGDAV